jgi:hypothetical protein
MLTLIAALCILAVIAISSAIPPNDQTDPSSRSAGSLGTLALYTWFSDLGLNVGRITTTFTLAGSDIVFCYDPTVALSTSDVTKVMTFLRSGGDLVLVVTPTSLANAAPLLSALDVSPTAELGGGVATVAQPFDSTDRVRSVTVSSGLTFSDTTPLVPMLVEQNSVVAGMVRVGSGGRAYVLGNTEPLSAGAECHRLRDRNGTAVRSQPPARADRRALRRRAQTQGRQRHRRGLASRRPDLLRGHCRGERLLGCIAGHAARPRASTRRGPAGGERSAPARSRCRLLRAAMDGCGSWMSM